MWLEFCIMCNIAQEEITFYNCLLILRAEKQSLHWLMSPRDLFLEDEILSRMHSTDDYFHLK